MAEGQDGFRTDDMAMVSSMKYMGHTPSQIVWEDEKCYWFFDRTTNLLAHVEEYLQRKLQVEPKQFNFLFGETKKEFYKLLDAHRPRRS